MATAALVVVFGLSMVAGLALTSVALATPRLTIARVALAGYMMSTVAWSAISLTSDLTNPDDPTIAIVWILPVVAIMVSFFRVLIQALRNAAWTPSRWYVASLLAHPVAMIVLAAVPSWHSLLVSVDAKGHASYAPLFWIHAALSYGLLVASLILLVTARRTLPALATRSLSLTMATWSLPVAANLFTIIHDGADGTDLTPVAFTVTALFMGRSLIQDGLADVIPVARVEVFESLTDAVLVLDTAGRVIDANSRAEHVLSLMGFTGRYHGYRLGDISDRFEDAVAADGERDVTVAGTDYVVQVHRSELRDRKGRPIGTLIHIRNITEEALRTRELIRVRDALAEEARINEELRAELADQVVRDVGTGLHNRRYVFEELPRIVASCEAQQEPLAIAMVDVDHFKDINDSYGHAAGDRALRAVAQAMHEAARGAIVARFGGEEFIVILPGHTRDDAVARVEAMREACAAVQVPAREGSINVTLSAGLAWSGPAGIDANRLIELADDALYAAKNAGRDRICVAGRDGL